MKHIRSLDVDQPLDELLRRQTAERAYLAEEQYAGPNFFRGLIVALAISLSAYSALFIAFF